MYKELSEEDLRAMFEGTIVRYKGDPVYIKSAIDRMLMLTDIVTQKVVDTVEPDSKHIDFKNMPLGFFNLDTGGAAWVSRVPQRQFKVGIVTGNLNISPVSQVLNVVSVKEAFKQPLIDAIKGKYPSKEEAIAAVEGKKKVSRAFNRFFAIDGDLNLYHRINKVGMINSENGKPIFHASKNYLKALME
jgi:hypothetical protein